MFVDKIYTINLEIRKDRKMACIRHANTFRFEQEFIKAVDGDTLNIPELLEEKIIDDHFLDPGGVNCTKGTYGCSLSHIKAWKKAYDDGAEVALFLEDDYVISPFVDVSYITRDMKNYIMNCDWDILFLGKNKRYVTGDTVNSLMVKTTEDWLSKPLKTRRVKENIDYWGAHAYLVRRDAIKYLIDNYTPINMAVDVWLQYLTRKGPLNIYTLQESLIYQQSTLKQLQNGNFLTNKERNDMIDSDTYHNHNRKGKFRWIQVPRFSSSISQEEYMWRFNIRGSE